MRLLLISSLPPSLSFSFFANERKKTLAKKRTTNNFCLATVDKEERKKFAAASEYFTEKFPFSLPLTLSGAGAHEYPDPDIFCQKDLELDLHAKEF
jgi:hypothetical protein